MRIDLLEHFAAGLVISMLVLFEEITHGHVAAFNQGLAYGYEVYQWVRLKLNAEYQGKPDWSDAFAMVAGNTLGLMVLGWVLT